MAKQKILGMPIRVAPYETFEIVALVVNTEYDVDGYTPCPVNPKDVGYEIYTSDGAIVKNGTFDISPRDGLILTHDNLQLEHDGIYAVFFFSKAIDSYGFTVIHVGYADAVITANIDATISSRASQSTANEIRNQTNKLQFDDYNNVKARVENIEEVVDATWDEQVGDHVSTGTFGRYISEIYGKVLTILDKLKPKW